MTTIKTLKQPIPETSEYFKICIKYECVPQNTHQVAMQLNSSLANWDMFD